MESMEIDEGHGAGTGAQGIGSAVVWHDAENGGYAADLSHWERLAREGGGPVLDLGAGTGRVSLHLARLGIETIALDNEPELLEALSERAQAAGLDVRTVTADARELGSLGLDAPTVIAPMQLAHLLDGPEGRARLLRGALEVLPPGGRIHLALLSEAAETEVGDELTPPPLPDVREQDGWVHSSLPVAVGWGNGVIQIHRQRQLVSPAGELHEEHHMIQLDQLSPAELEAEASALGFEVLERSEVALTSDHVGSVVVSLEAP
jgi:SAM-dependent methyltransferase